MTIVVRDMGDGDRAYVLSTWVESEEAHARLPGPRERAFAALRGKARALLARSRVLVAAPEDDEITILAWLALDAREAGLVHYAYTRRPFRRSGLVASLAERASLRGRVLMSCARPKRASCARAVYDPMVGWMLAVAGEEMR